MPDPIQVTPEMPSAASVAPLDAMPSDVSNPQPQQASLNPTAGLTAPDQSIAAPTQAQSLDQTKQILSGDGGTPQPTLDRPAARGGMFFRILTGALKGMGEGAVMGGIPGAIEGAVSPKTAQTNWDAQKSLQQSKVDFWQAHAAFETTNALNAHRIMDQQTDEWKQSQNDRAIERMHERQSYGLTPTNIVNDDSDNGVRIASDMVKNGQIPFVDHLPSTDGQHGQLVVYDLSPLVKAQTIAPAVKQGLDEPGITLTDQDYARMNLDQRLRIVQQGMQGIHLTPGNSPAEILSQINDLQSKQRVYALQHGNDPNVKDRVNDFSDEINFLQQARKNLMAGQSQQDQQAAQAAGRKAQATGEQQKNLAEANKANQETVSASALSQPDALGFTPNIGAVGGPKNYESIAKSFKKNADDLAQTDQMYSQFQNVMKDVNAGKDITGAQSVVTLFNSIGLSAEPLKGKGFRINNATVEEHANARGLGDSLYQKLLRVKDGDVITPQQIKDYASIAQQAWVQKHVAVATEAHNAGVNADFALPSGNGQKLDTDTARIFAALTGGDINKARVAAQKKGWVL